MASSGFGNTNNGKNGGTEFLSILPPPNGDVAEYDNTRPHNKQTAAIPQIFRDAMSIREEVYGEQGVPLEAEFDDDDARSWHWVVYASVASTASSPPSDLRDSTATSSEDDARRSSATGTRLPVGTIRLIPGPHKPNQYLEKPGGHETDKHADAAPPAEVQAANGDPPMEPYVKLGRLAVLAPYRKLGLARLLINTALDYAAKNHEDIYHPPSPTTMEMASLRRDSVPEAMAWQGLVMIHAQASLKTMWERYGFAEELRNENGEIEIGKEPHWIEEGIEHVGMWRRLRIDNSRS